MRSVEVLAGDQLTDEQQVALRILLKVWDEYDREFDALKRTVTQCVSTHEELNARFHGLQYAIEKVTGRPLSIPCDTAAESTND